ncbi:MAG: hypothetical protein K5829_04965 [Treponema sp.]|nr:hypothetical protein [Treponema sp.]
MIGKKSLESEKIFVFLLILSVAFNLSAESKKYYKNKKLINTMYVNSLEGLKVRDTPNLSGKRICGLINALPVKIIEIENETEIDGIKDNWVKILIPAYEWAKNAANEAREIIQRITMKK